MKKINFMMIMIAIFAFTSCTKLDQSLRGETTQDDPNITAGGLLSSAYETMNSPYQDQARLWCLAEHTTDEVVGPTRGGDWDDNGVWRVLHAHTWDADHAFAAATFKELLQTQFAASLVLTKTTTPQQNAEARFIRALSMFSVLDHWDQVPYRSDLVDLKKLPETKKGAACADFIIAELEAIVGNLPATGAANKANQNAARTLLMKLYLNRGVYGNRAAPTFAAADMSKVITLADQVTGYTLTPNYFRNFAPTNDALSTENIYTLENAPGVKGGNIRSRWYMTTHYNQNPGGWNGFTTLSDFYNKFEAVDARRGQSYTGLTNVTGMRAGFLIGQQFDQNGVALQGRNTPMIFTPAVALIESGNSLDVTGIRVVKYIPDLASPGDQKDNDYVIFRLSDVMLMKAEALLRGGTATTGTALSMVNNLRTARSATPLAAVTLDNVLDERGRELYWEGWRRNDLVRFGKFLAPNQLKAATEAKRLLFAIPSEQLALNPNLTQNPGY
jgi:starch-binding outer membrane protein, SusD/RagB family